MTFTRLTRQQKDVRNDKCKEEEEWYYQSANYLFVLPIHTMLRQIVQ